MKLRNCEFVGPQIELDLGEGSSIFDEEPAVEASKEVSTGVVDEEDSSVEFVVSGKETMTNQAEGAGGEPVPEDAQMMEAGVAIGTGEPVPEVDRSGAAPDLMEIDAAVRTGEVPVLEEVDEGTRPEPVPDVGEEKTGEAPVQEILEAGTGSEPVPEEVEQGAGAVPDLGSGEGDLHIEDFPGDEFERVGDLVAEESTQPAPAPAPKHPAETPLGGEPRKKRVKTLAGRTNLQWVRKLKALKEKTSSSSPKSPPKQAAQPARKSYRLVAQGIRSSTQHQGSPVIKELSSSSEGSPTPSPVPVQEHREEAPVQGSEQASRETSPHKSPSPKPVLKRKAVAPPSPATQSPAGPSAKKPKSAVAPSPKLEKFQKRGVVRGKVVKVSYFQDQGLEVFLDKLKAQGWYELFTNTQLGCSQPDVAEFYANVTLHGDVISSSVNGVLIEVNAQALGVILGVPATGFDLHIREDKKPLSRDRLLELSRHLSQQPGLRSPQAVKKGDMQPLHQLLF